MTQTRNSIVPKWRSVPQNEIVWSQWDNAFVAYHRPSGKTHYLNAASEQLLTRILLVANDANTVAAEFAMFSEDEDQIVEEVTAMLMHLEQLGLVSHL